MGTVEVPLWNHKLLGWGVKPKRLAVRTELATHESAEEGLSKMMVGCVSKCPAVERTPQIVLVSVCARQAVLCRWTMQGVNQTSSSSDLCKQRELDLSLLPEVSGRKHWWQAVREHLMQTSNFLSCQWFSPALLPLYGQKCDMLLSEMSQWKPSEQAGLK